jgi:hypothetical protein
MHGSASETSARHRCSNVSRGATRATVGGVKQLNIDFIAEK